MARITTFTHVTLDGVMQAPGRPDEDPRGGFAHGGWAVPLPRRGHGRRPAEGMAGEGATAVRPPHLRGLLHGVWPNAPQPNPFTEVLDNSQKYVASRTLKRAAAVGELDAAPGRRRRRGRAAEGGRRQGTSSCSAAAT